MMCFEISDFFFSNAVAFVLSMKLYKPLLLMVIYMLQVGIVLLVLQQLCGINAVLFYSSNIFESAG